MNDLYNISIEMGNMQANIVTREKKDYAVNAWSVRLHFHLFYELHVLKKGSVTLRTLHGETELHEGNIVFIPPCISHEIIQQSDDVIHYSFFFSTKKIAAPRSNFSDYHYYQDNLNLVDDIFIIDGNETLNNGIDYITNYLVKLNEPLIYKAKAIFTLCFLELNDIIKQRYGNIHDFSDTSKKDSFPVEMDKRKWEIDAYISSHYSEDINLDHFAEYLHLSAQQANRTAKQLTGYCFNELLTKQRMEVAKLLIDTATDRSLEDIALTVGYNSYTAFYLNFKKYFGSSPKDTKMFEE